MSKYVIEVEVDENILRKISNNDQDTIEELISSESNWLEESGITCDEVFKSVNPKFYNFKKCMMTACQKLDVINLFYESYYNVNESATEFGSEFYFLVNEIIKNNLPTTLDKLALDEITDDIIEIVPSAEALYVKGEVVESDISIYISTIVEKDVSYTKVNEIRQDGKSICKFDVLAEMIDFTPIKHWKNKSVTIYNNNGYAKKIKLVKVVPDTRNGIKGLALCFDGEL